MTVHAETANERRKSTPWQTLRKSLTAIYEGMNYDPHEYANEMVRHLFQEVEQLQTRVSELEDERNER